MLVFNAALMISDRAPGLFGDSIQRVSERIDAGARVRSVASDARLPESDTLVHIGVWALAAGLVGIAVWSWRGLIVGGAVVFAGSLVVELSQDRLSDSRSFERSDVAANALGVALGVVATALCYIVWSAVARVFGAVPVRSDRHRFGDPAAGPTRGDKRSPHLLGLGQTVGNHHENRRVVTESEVAATHLDVLAERSGRQER